VRIKHITEQDYAGSTVFFPAAGIIIGILLVLFNAVISGILPQMPAVCFLLIFWVFITGALHLDGLADTIDGFYASTIKEEILQAMEDTATGAKGVAALVMILLFKFALLLSMEGTIRVCALVLAPAISRYSLVLAMANSKPAREKGIARLFMGKVGWAKLIISTFIVLAPAFVCSYFLPSKMLGFLAMAVSVMVTATFVQYCNYKIDGMTGDTLGALNEIVEIVVLLVIAAINFMRGVL